MEHGVRRYREHDIELRPRRATARAKLDRTEPITGDLGELLIDGEPVGYGRLVDGTLFLEESAYEWGDDLGELAEKLIDYRDRADEVRGRGGRGA